MTNARERMMARILNLDADEDEERQGGGSHGNTHLPYGLCEEFGIDTTGFSPTDCWKALQGKGVDPKAAYSSLQKEGTIKPYASEVKASNNAKTTEKKPAAKKTPSMVKLNARRMKLINSLNDEKKWPEKPVTQDSKGRQYYTNGDMAFRFNNAITDEVGENSRTTHLMDLVEDMLDNYNRGDAVKADITPQELGYFMDKAKKDETEQKKKLKPTPYEKEYGIKKEGKFQKNVISFSFGDKEISVDPKYLRNALQVFPDAEFFPMTDAKNHIVLGVKGADGEGFIMPITGETKKTNIKDVPRGKEAAPQKPENSNAPKPISDGDKKRVAAIEKLARIGDVAPKVYDAPDGKQVFCNNFMGIRYDKPVVANPSEDKSQGAEKICNLIDKARESCTDELKGFSMQDLTKFMKGIGAVIKEETGKRVGKEDYGIVLTDYKNLPHEVNSIYGSNAMGTGNVVIDARLLYNTASQLKNPKIYLSGNAMSSIYIKGDDGDALVCPIRYNTIKNFRDYKTMKKARYEE